MKDLTEVDAFTTPVTVPEGTDSRDRAAEHVEAIAQALANRTKNLKALHEALDADFDALGADAARKSAANTFTQPNTFQNVNANDVTTHDIHSTNDIHADHNITSGNWLGSLDITATRDIDCGRNYTYLPMPPRTTVIPYQAAIFAGAGYLTTVPGSITLPPNSRAEFPIRLPALATLGFVRACVGTLGSADWYISIHKLTPSFSGGGNFGTVANVGTGGSGTVTGASAPDIAQANGNGASIDPESAYWVEIGNPNTSANDLVVSAIQLNWVDPGPRNH